LLRTRPLHEPSGQGVVATIRPKPDPTEAPDDPASARAKPLPRRLPELLEPTDPSTFSDLPLVPARMINEVLYCERLMSLEWVQGEWAANAFTADGKSVHRRVNEEGKPLRKP